jgi:uncharacterized membrane protein
MASAGHDIGVLVFFLFYAFVYNWCYDVIRARLVEKRVAAIPLAPARTGNRQA